MLIDKPIRENDVISLKLTTGEEVIATYKEFTDTHIVVTKPATIAANQQGMGIVPWMMTARPEKIRLNISTVIAYALTDENIAKSYTQATTDIQLAQ
jgi:hypothetical protein